MKNIFIDDLRMPDQAFVKEGDKLISLEEYSGIKNKDWYIVRNYDEFIDALERRGIPNNVSFDHDLCYEHIQHYFKETMQSSYIEYSALTERTGKHCADYLVYFWKKCAKATTPNCFIHSANEVGANNIKESLREILEYGQN